MPIFYVTMFAVWPVTILPITPFSLLLLGYFTGLPKGHSCHCPKHRAVDSLSQFHDQQARSWSRPWEWSQRVSSLNLKSQLVSAIRVMFSMMWHSLEIIYCPVCVSFQLMILILFITLLFVKPYKLVLVQTINIQTDCLSLEPKLKTSFISWINEFMLCNQ